MLELNAKATLKRVVRATAVVEKKERGTCGFIVVAIFSNNFATVQFPNFVQS